MAGFSNSGAGFTIPGGLSLGGNGLSLNAGGTSLYGQGFTLQGNVPSLVSLWANAVAANGGSVTPARTAIIQTFIAAEQASGAWDLTDDYWGLWGENAPQALTSLKQRRLATAVNSPTFTANRSYAFNGTTNYINTGFIPSVNAVAYSGTNQRIAAYETTNVSTSSTYTAGTRVGTSAAVGLTNRASNSLIGALNNTAGAVNFVLSPADSRGLKAISRANGGTTARGYDRGVRLTDVTGLTIGGTGRSSVALTLAVLNSAGTLVSYRAASIGFVAIGAPLTDAQELAQYNNVQAWATAIGAAV